MFLFNGDISTRGTHGPLLDRRTAKMPTEPRLRMISANPFESRSHAMVGRGCEGRGMLVALF